ncbi:MAG: AAA family ATPase, partial [Candidatus Nanopelagicales bacterium]
MTAEVSAVELGTVAAPRVIAVIGGECSGKSTLANALAQDLDAVLAVEELRKFVEEYGRPPLVNEQAAV